VAATTCSLHTTWNLSLTMENSHRQEGGPACSYRRSPAPHTQAGGRLQWEPWDLPWRRAGEPTHACPHRLHRRGPTEEASLRRSLEDLCSIPGGGGLPLMQAVPHPVSLTGLEA